METAKKKYTLINLFPPGFIKIGGQRYLMPGWTPVDDSVTFSDVEHINPWKSVIETFSVKGSTGGNYTVTKRNDAFTCDCPAGKFRGKCKHTDIIKNQLKLT